VFDEVALWWVVARREQAHRRYPEWSVVIGHEKRCVAQRDKRAGTVVRKREDRQPVFLIVLLHGAAALLAWPLGIVIGRATGFQVVDAFPKGQRGCACIRRQVSLLIIEHPVHRPARGPIGGYVGGLASLLQCIYILLSGTTLVEMTDHPPARIGPGGFAMMVSHMPYQFSCRGDAICDDLNFRWNLRH
jgi:hypothetical protein